MSKRKAPSNDTNPNKDICDFLNELADYERNVSRNVYKYNAYRKASSSIASSPRRLTSAKEAKKLEGVGDKISKKIEEYLQTGKLEKLEKIHADDTSIAINELSRVVGIGPAKARVLVDQGIYSIEDLRKHTDKLNHQQKIGIKYFEELEQKIPRSEIQKLEELIRKEVSKLDPKYTLTICGSYRRGASLSSDIDVLLTHPDYTSEHKGTNLLHKVVKQLEGKLITDTLSLGDVKFMGVCQHPSKPGEAENLHRRLDIRLTPFDQYWCSILYFTGSDLFNQRMRVYALEHRFTLNEYSLRPVGVTGVPGEPVPISSEEDIFEYINFPYVPPKERNM